MIAELDQLLTSLLTVWFIAAYRYCEPGCSFATQKSGALAAHLYALHGLADFVTQHRDSPSLEAVSLCKLYRLRLDIRLEERLELLGKNRLAVLLAKVII